MNVNSYNIVRLLTINRSRLLVIAALVAPFIILHLTTERGASYPQNSTSASTKEGKIAPNKDFPFLTLDYMRAITTGKVKRAETLTTEKYEAMRKNNPQLPATLEEYRSKTKARLDELKIMTSEQWQDEVNRKVPRMDETNQTLQNGPLVHSDPNTPTHP